MKSIHSNFESILKYVTLYNGTNNKYFRTKINLSNSMTYIICYVMIMSIYGKGGKDLGQYMVTLHLE